MSAISDRVTPKMVKMFAVDGFCQDRIPCLHECTITLLDGRRKKVDLAGDKIYVVISALAKKQIKGDAGHFDRYKGFRGVGRFYLVPADKTSYTRPIPAQVLSKVFEQRSSKNNSSTKSLDQKDCPVKWVV